MQEEYIEFQSNIEELLKMKKLAAKSGGNVWNKIKKNMDNKNSYVLLFPNDEEEILKYGMIYRTGSRRFNTVICIFSI